MQDTDTRQDKRYNHIFIKLKINLNEDWRPIKALDWNEKGFNFYLDHKLKHTQAEVLFKKAAVIFPGSVIWSCRNDDEELIMETILNSMLFSQLKKHHDILRDSVHRIIGLLRSQGLIDEKIKMLSHLGVHGLSQDTVRLMVEGHKKEYPAYRYGISAESAEWGEIVRQASEEAAIAPMPDQSEEPLR